MVRSVQGRSFHYRQLSIFVNLLMLEDLIQ
jgi:hypothetical protein